MNMSLDLRDVRYELDRMFTKTYNVEHNFELKDDLFYIWKETYKKKK